MSHKVYRTEKDCLNCGAVVQSRFCSECGQENVELKEDFFHLAGHVIADFFHFDSKFFRTIIPLFTKPGYLTKEYWAGRRVRYVHPLRLFFFIAIVFMISMTFFYSHFDKAIKGSMIFRTPGTNETRTLSLDEKQALTEKEKEDNRQVALLNRGVDAYFAQLKYISFFMLPLFGLVFKVLYRKSKRFYTDHLVYVLHLQSFAYVVVALLLLLPFAIPESISIVRRLMMLSILIYMILSLKQLYRQSWTRTIVKSLLSTFLLVMMMGVVLGLYMAGSLLIG